MRGSGVRSRLAKLEAAVMGPPGPTLADLIASTSGQPRPAKRDRRSLEELVRASCWELEVQRQAQAIVNEGGDVASVKARLAKLEEALKPNRVRIVFVGEGETMPKAKAGEKLIGVSSSYAGTTLVVHDPFRGEVATGTALELAKRSRGLTGSHPDPAPPPPPPDGPDPRVVPGERRINDIPLDVPYRPELLYAVSPNAPLAPQKGLASLDQPVLVRLYHPVGGRVANSVVPVTAVMAAHLEREGLAEILEQSASPGAASFLMTASRGTRGGDA